MRLYLASGETVSFTRVLTRQCDATRERRCSAPAPHRRASDAARLPLTSTCNGARSLPPAGGSVFNITWVGAPSAGRWEGVALTLPNAWTNVSASFFTPDMATVDAHFSNGHHGLGNVSGGCTSFAWNDGSSWKFAGAAPTGKINVHFAMHTHDDV
jgi:hypothetical protein